MKKLKSRIKALDKVSGNKTHASRSALDVFMAGALFGLYSKKIHINENSTEKTNSNQKISNDQSSESLSFENKKLLVNLKNDLKEDEFNLFQKGIYSANTDQLINAFSGVQPSQVSREKVTTDSSPEKNYSSLADNLVQNLKTNSSQLASYEDQIQKNIKADNSLPELATNNLSQLKTSKIASQKNAENTVSKEEGMENVGGGFSEEELPSYQEILEEIEENLDGNKQEINDRVTDEKLQELPKSTETKFESNDPEKVPENTDLESSSNVDDVKESYSSSIS